VQSIYEILSVKQKMAINIHHDFRRLRKNLYKIVSLKSFLLIYMLYKLLINENI